MGRRVSKRVVAAAVAMVAVVVLAGLTLRERPQVTAVEEWFHDTLSPVAAVFHTGIGAVGDTVQTLARLSRLQADNVRLQAELDRLAGAEGRLTEAAAEIQRLQALLALKADLPVTGRAARIIGRSPSNWFESVTVDVGRVDGSRPNAVVVNPQGVVGRVARITARTSTVMLLTDAQMSVGAAVARSRYAGVLLGGHRQAGRLLMRFFDYDADVRPGDRIVTSGLGGVFPPGVDLGWVEAVERDPVRLLVLATVGPAVDFGRLDEVLVLEPVPAADGGQ